MSEARTDGTVAARPPRARRGLSLVETLAAAAILAATVAACVPLLRLAGAGPAGSAAPAVDAALLGELADRIAADPEGHGLTPRTGTEMAVPWPDDLASSADRPLPDASVEPLAPTRLSSTDPEDARSERWLVVRAGGEVVHRWTRLRPEAGRQPRRGNRRRRTRGPARPRRGLTLVEAVLSLAVLSVLAAAAFSFAAAAARIAREASAREAADRGREAVLRLLAEDLGSLDAPRTEARGAPPRVRLEGDALVVRTRASLPGTGGPVERRYVSDRARRTLLAQDRPLGGGGSAPASAPRTIATGVTEWSVAVEDRAAGGARRGPRGGDAPIAVAVTIAIDGAPPITRRFPCAR